MARSTSTSADGRARITSPSKDLTEDNGSVLCSVVHGEQIHLEFTANWMTNMNGATVTAKVVEGDNDGLGTQPTAPRAGGTITSLPIIDDDTTDNIFKVVVTDDLIATWATEPEPNKPVYGFFDLEIVDAGIGDGQQIWKPVRGLIEVLYSPTEEV